jgi:hypothetical protein
VREKYNLESLWGDAPRAGAGKPKKKRAVKKISPGAKARRATP